MLHAILPGAVSIIGAATIGDLKPYSLEAGLICQQHEAERDRSIEVPIKSSLAGLR